jgi:uncharacterized protein YegP (UPF0339 family)
MSENHYLIWNIGPEKEFKIYRDQKNHFKELLRLHANGKVTVRGKTYKDMSEMARDIFGVCKWRYSDWKYETSCKDEYDSHHDIKDIGIKFCPYCGKEIEEIKNE